MKLTQVRYHVGSGDLRGVRHQQLAVGGLHAAQIRMRAERLERRVKLSLALGRGLEVAAGPAGRAED